MWYEFVYSFVFALTMNKAYEGDPTIPEAFLLLANLQEKKLSKRWVAVYSCTQIFKSEARSVVHHCAFLILKQIEGELHRADLEELKNSQLNVRTLLKHSQALDKFVFDINAIAGQYILFY